MPRKSKKKGKKGVHTIPEVHPHVLRNRERRRIKAEKERARALKRCRKNRKQALSETVFSPGDSTEVPEPCRYVTSDEESHVQENIDFHNSSNRQTGTSRAERQEVRNEAESINGNKKTGFYDLYMQEQQRQATKSEDHMTQKNIKGSKQHPINVPVIFWGSSQSLPLNDSLEEKLHKNQQVNTQFGACNKMDYVVEKPVDKLNAQEKSVIVTQPEDLGTQRKLKGSKRVKYNDYGTEQSFSQSISQTCSHDASLQGNQIETQQTSQNKVFDGKMKENEISTPQKPIEDIEIMYSDLKVHRELNAELIRKKILLQQKEEELKSLQKSADEQENQHVPLQKRKDAETPELAARGVIRVFSSKKSDKNHDSKGQIYNVNKRKIQVGDENVNISIVVSRDRQVICNLRQRPADMPCDESSSGTLEGRASVMSEKDVASDPQQNGKALTDSSISSSVSKFPEENCSRLNSVEENIKKVCANFLKDFTSVCQNFEARAMNYIKGDLIKFTKV